jgi:hypothetical protein
MPLGNGFIFLGPFFFGAAEDSLALLFVDIAFYCNYSQ